MKEFQIVLSNTTDGELARRCVKSDATIDIKAALIDLISTTPLFFPGDNIAITETAS